MSRVGLLALLFVAVAVSSASAGPWQGFTSLLLSPDGLSFATGGREGELLWWESASGEVKGRWLVPGGKPLVGLAFDTGGTHLGAVALDGSTAWATPSDPGLSPLPAESAAGKTLAGAVARWMASSPPAFGVQVVAGGLRAVGTPDGRIVVESLAGGRKSVQWQAHDSGVTGLALSPDGSYLLSVGYDGTLCRWDPATGVLLGRL